MAAQHEQAAGAAPQERSAASSLLREVAEVLVLAVILYFGISFAVQAVHVEGISMFATLDDQDYLIANKIDYRLHAPQRGDIIILRPPTNNSTDFIKRIIGLPGERILIRSGVVYINGHRLHEPYLPEEWVNDANWPDNSSTGRLLGPDEYFVPSAGTGSTERHGFASGRSTTSATSTSRCRRWTAVPSSPGTANPCDLSRLRASRPLRRSRRVKPRSRAGTRRRAERARPPPSAAARSRPRRRHA